MINQFPFEMVLTVKSLLPVVCRRGISSPLIDPVTLDTLPVWLPITFNLKTEIAQFVSYYQHREARFVLGGHFFEYICCVLILFSPVVFILKQTRFVDQTNVLPK